MGLKVTVPVALAWFIVGVVAFSSLKKLTSKKPATMVNKIAKSVMGVALVGRTVPTLSYKDFAVVADVTLIQDRERGFEAPTPHHPSILVD